MRARYDLQKMLKEIAEDEKHSIQPANIQLTQAEINRLIIDRKRRKKTGGE